MNMSDKPAGAALNERGKDVDKINITEVATKRANRKPVLTHRLLG